MINEKKKIRVLFGINDFLVGGLQRQLARQLVYFNRDLFDFYIVTLFDFPNKETLFNLIPSDVRVVRLGFTNFYDLNSWWKLMKTIHNIKPDIVLSGLFFSNTIFRLLKPLFGYKVIASEHNTYINKRWFEIKLDWSLSFISSRIVAVSEDVANFTIKQESISRDKFVTIRNGIDLDEIQKKINLYGSDKDKIKKELNLPSDKKIIINVARLTSQKNQELLVKAFGFFKKTNPNFILLILGEGSLFVRIENLINSMGLSDSVYLLGSKTDIEKYYLVADCFVSTSKIEGLSNAFLEALAFGLPIVTTRTGGSSELVIEGYNGYFINQENEQEVSVQLDRWLTSDQTKLRKNSKELVLKFDIKKTVWDYESLFHQTEKGNF